MTLAIEKPAPDLSTSDVKVVLPDCPPWCIGEPDWHDPDYAVVHASNHHSERTPMSGHGWDALGDIDNDFATYARAHLMMDRHQGLMVEIGLGGAPRSARVGANSDAIATLDETERFALHLLALVALGREGGEVR
ncbi:hypothetical protein ACQEVZ_24720 [Dactylosporangium sp. CA-152071]|uniref:hypothetical protein n=1 Tax=Dactylosporangium sp. CA-152071 TaxID=3239933 RepID=UPI003D8BB765